MSQAIIQITPRALNQNLNTLRKEGMIPGIMYGQSLKDSLPIQIHEKDLQTLVNTTSQTTTFCVEYEGQPHECILREYQTDRLHTSFLHVDLQYVKDDEIIKMNIPVHYDGIELVRNKKLILEKFIPKLPVVGPIQNLPEAFSIDVSNLDRGAKILASQVVLPTHTELLMNPETIIATIQ